MQVRALLRVHRDRELRCAAVATSVSAGVRAIEEAEREWERRRQVVAGREMALEKWEARIRESLEAAKAAFAVTEEKVGSRITAMQALLDQRTVELEEERLKSARLAEAGKAKEFFRARSRAAEAELLRERATAERLRKQLSALQTKPVRRG